jgi:hypothetical protein
MSEANNLVAIYGAIDQAAQADPGLRAAVSRLLPLYRDPDLSWYEDFQGWINQTRGEGAGARFHTLNVALRKLADIEPQRRMRARRLFAIAAAMQAFPDMRNPSSKLGAKARAALCVGTSAQEDERALSLHKLLADGDSLPSAAGAPEDLSAWWDKLVETAYSEGFISSTTGMRPRPCSGRLVKVPGVEGPVAALETEFVTDEIDFDQATRFIEPVNWATCMPDFWCEMTRLNVQLPPGVYRYQEVVSTDCANKARAAFTAATELDFSFISLPDAASPEAVFTNYQLSDGRPFAGDLILVDEGSLLVSKIGTGPRPLRVTTTKRIKFSYPFSSQALATIMCALGYADVVGELLCCAASSPEGAGTTYPGVPPATVGIPSDSVSTPKDCLEECAAAALSWSMRIAEGPYTADQLVQDTAGVWARVLREGATAADLGVRATQSATRTRTRERPEG